jgi:branched-chain amino acid transport system ATP-binding protein
MRLCGLSTQARPREITAIIAQVSKTSTLMAVSGRAVTGGEILLEDRPSRTPPHQVPALGISQILEGRQLFADQTVADNLLLGAYTRLRQNRARVHELLEREMDRFPILRKRRRQL